MYLQNLKKSGPIQLIKDSPATKLDYDVYIDFDKNPMGYWYTWDGTMGGIRSIEGNKGFKVSRANAYGGFGIDTNNGVNTVPKKEGLSVPNMDLSIKGKAYTKICLGITGTKLPDKMKVEITTYDGDVYELFFNPKVGTNVLDAEELADLKLNSINISKLQFGFPAGAYDFTVDDIGFKK
jgi:hypothetical protein